MKLALIAFFVALSPAWAAEEQISSSRLTSLSCQAWNAFGASHFELEGADVNSVTNGLFPKAYRLSNIGNSAEYHFGFVNLSAGRDIASFVFPSQELGVGQQTLQGILFLNQVVNPFQPVNGLGTPWAQATCQVKVSAR